MNGLERRIVAIDWRELRLIALSTDDTNLAKFEDKLGRQPRWQTYGLSKESIRLARDTVTE